MLLVVMARSCCGSVAIRYIVLVLWMMSCFPVIGKAEAMHILKMTHRGAAWIQCGREYGVHIVQMNSSAVILWKNNVYATVRGNKLASGEV